MLLKNGYDRSGVGKFLKSRSNPEFALLLSKFIILWIELDTLIKIKPLIQTIIQERNEFKVTRKINSDKFKLVQAYLFNK